MHAGDAALRDEMRAGFAAQQAEIQRVELSLRDEMHAGDAALRDEIQRVETSLRDEIVALTVDMRKTQYDSLKIYLGGIAALLALY
jgi:hypothetical protein